MRTFSAFIADTQSAALMGPRGYIAVPDINSLADGRTADSPHVDQTRDF